MTITILLNNHSFTPPTFTSNLAPLLLRSQTHKEGHLVSVLLLAADNWALHNGQLADDLGLARENAEFKGTDEDEQCNLDLGESKAVAAAMSGTSKQNGLLTCNCGDRPRR
jgi:hypothetical protein